LNIPVLSDFLETKPLYYEKINYERMPYIYKKVHTSLPKPKIIHLIGTNGKGTTGRFLATALRSKGHYVGHYTSPHILKFNERIWIDGEDIPDSLLETLHIKLFSLLEREDRDALSYFEYTTLLAMLAFEKCEYVVLEAGLGGEYDATAVFDKELTLFTPIDFDHTAFLGDTIKAIAATKLNAMQKTALVGLQKYSEVYEIAQSIASKKGTKLNLLKDENSSFWNKISKISEAMQLPKYLAENLALAACALQKLGFEFSSDDFKDTRLFGRLTQIAPNVMLDVGHNALAAGAIAKALEGQKITLIYNTYKDKDFKAILTLLKPIIDTVEIISVDDGRIVERSSLEKILHELKLSYSDYKEVQPDKKYLVFGSFSVAETFLKGLGQH
jgi:dihydrofolate synthase/folylpolyglutamate synthase